MPSYRSLEIRPIDHSSPIPYYHQLADILREEIERGTWAVDELIPAEGALTEMFDVSRSVTRKALEVLEGEGRVLRIKGKGTIVIGPKFAGGPTVSARRWFFKRSSSIRLRDILQSSKVMAGGDLAKIIGLAPRDQVWELVLTHEDNAGLVSLSQVYLKIQGTLTVGAPPQFADGGPDFFSQLSSRYEIDIVKSQLEMQIVEAGSLESDILGIPQGTTLVEQSSLEFGAKGGVVGFVRTVVPANKFFIAAEVERRRDHTGESAPSTFRSLVSAENRSDHRMSDES